MSTRGGNGSRRGAGRRAAGRASQRESLRREAEEVLALVRSLWRDLLRNPYAEAEQHGMTGPQVTVMSCLVVRGPLALTELSRAVGMSHSSASGIIDRLEARGLVRRAEDPADRRRSSIEVTDSVRRYVRELQEGPAGRLARLLEAAGPAERVAILKGLRLLRDLLGASRAATPREP